MRRVGFPVDFLSVGSPLVYFDPVGLVEMPQKWLPRGRWQGGAMHTFCDDYRQEFFWRRPGEGVLVAIAAGYVTAPDYTVYSDDPEEWALYQCWRSALVAAYWQKFGVKVLPVVAFKGKPYRFVPKGSVWAVRGPGRGSDVGVWRSEIEIFCRCALPHSLVVFGNKVAGLPVPVIARPLLSKKGGA
jgi:hypothetical protein